MQIDIYSDVICPWCFIGKRRLERALAMRPDLKPMIRWRPFQLNPDMPPQGMDRGTYLAVKFGGAERAAQTYAPIKTAGAGEGIDFAFDKISVTPNTVQAHRLLAYASDHDRQMDMKEALLKAYFLEGKNLGDDTVLADAAASIGLNRDDVIYFLAGDDGRDAVIQEDEFIRSRGLNGVPSFIFNGQYVLMGAQPPEAFLQMFDLAREADQLAQTSQAQTR